MRIVDIVTGTTEAHLVYLDQSLHNAPPVQIHQQVLEPLIELREAAASAGFGLCLCSGFRSFQRQLQIWNGKASGERPVVDDSGKLIDIRDLSPWDQVQAIMRWSALPGASRHHWGTDFDIYDASAMPECYQLQLTPEETQGQGIFAPMHTWLDTHLPTTGFYRPYAIDRGGIAPERWHLSYRSLADQYAEVIDRELLEARLRQSNLLLLDVVVAHWDEILQRYLLLN